ncbi:hypothetical protein HCU40_03015 [Pseudanabaena biceps]|nr:hypothetical protein [Pseudanabaena biceps]
MIAFAFNRMDLEVSLLAIDPLKRELNFRFAPSPEGKFSKDSRLTQELKFFTGIESGKSEVTFEKNRIPDAVTGSITLHDYRSWKVLA